MVDQEPLSQLQDHLGADRVSVSAMFGKPALTDHNGKAFACLLDGEVAFRLGRDSAAHAEALGLDGSHLFDPSGKDRPMKDWVSVPPTHANRWADFARFALAVER
ncbi:MAG TPA: hypothetical protein VH969_33455 [Actinophytocola sp.]|jgi:hypothetical protein|uniref:hypothetical protein n=1 Tax=Actinophytocola sp. TaxID=1872138 RepID=UPI002F93017F